MFRILTAIAVAAALPIPLAAQEASPDALAAAQEAQQTGRQMAQVQAAVALAQRQYAGMTGGNIGAEYQGAIALPGAQPDSWLAIIVGRRGDGREAELVALGEYEIAGGALVSEAVHLLAEAPVLDGTASAMAQARAFAPRAIIAAGNSTFCAAGDGDSVTFATIVMPVREDGTFDAWVLNGPIEDGAIPLGRHFRVGFDEFGLDGDPELVTDTCETVTWDAADPDLAMSVYVTRFDGDAPTPIHAYVSSLLPMSMGVVTGDLIWPMAGGTIAAPVPAAEAGYAAAD